MHCNFRELVHLYIPAVCTQTICVDSLISASIIFLHPDGILNMWLLKSKLHWVTDQKQNLRGSIFEPSSPLIGYLGLFEFVPPTNTVFRFL